MMPSPPAPSCAEIINLRTIHKDRPLFCHKVFVLFPFVDGIFLPESAFVASVGNFIEAHGSLDGSGKQPFYHNAGTYSSERRRNTGGKRVYLFFPCLGSTAFWTFGWDTCHNTLSFSCCAFIIQQKTGGGKPRLLVDWNISNRVSPMA